MRIFCVRSAALPQRDRCSAGQRYQEPQQVQHGLGGHAGEARQQCVRQCREIHRRHEASAQCLPEIRTGKLLAPPLPPPLYRACGNRQHLGQPHRCRWCRTSVRHQHHCQRQVDAAAKKAHRCRRHTPSTLVAAEAQTRTEIAAHLARAAAWLARKVSLMKYAAAWAAAQAGLLG